MGYFIITKITKLLKTTTVILALFSLFGFTSCNDEKPHFEKETQNVEVNQTSPFREYLKKFQIRQFPFYYKGWLTETFEVGKLYTLNSNSNDTLFFNIKDDNIKCFGILEDTTNFFGLIYFRIGDAPVPILATYSKSGQLLDFQDLLCNGCGNDCGQFYCSYSANIKKNFEVYIADTSIYTGLCDSLEENEIIKIDSTFITYREGIIAKNGKINLGQTLIVRKKNSP